MRVRGPGYAQCVPGREDGELVHLIALLRTRPRGVGFADVTEAVIDAGSPAAAWEDAASDGGLFSDPDREAGLARAREELRLWTSKGYRVTPFYSREYPSQLREIFQMPPIVWSRGDLLANDVGVSVVGTRRPSDLGHRFARDVAAGLAECGLSVVSGLAAGVDTVAHTAALAADGRTVAVIGTGLDTSYPAQNRALQERVAHSGLVLSQFWPDAPPTKHSFPMRNAVMSGYSRVSVIVEAGEHSGTRIQGRVAVAHGRPVILSASVVRSTEWGRALTTRPGVHVAPTATEAVELARDLSQPALPGLSDLLRSLASA